VLTEQMLITEDPMKLKATGLLLLCVFGSMVRGQSLPLVHGTSVSGRPVQLPSDLKGKVAVLVIGFSRNSSFPVAAWASRFKADFGHDGDSVVLRLPFLEEVPRIFRGLAKSSVDKSADQDRDEVVPIFESEAAYKQLVHYSKPDDAYVLVVDGNGAIRGVFTGDVGNQYQSAHDQVARLLQDRAVGR
jgi:hypothetical protein